MTARSTSTSRASCCCPCGLARVVTVASGTRWGDATPCYASHHMMLVLLCIFKNYVFRQAKVYRVWPYTICRPNTKTKISRTRGHTTQRHTRTDFFFGMYQLETRFARKILWSYFRLTARTSGFHRFKNAPHILGRRLVCQ